MKIPDVSVVMSVYNGAQALPATLQSILAQENCEFEFIVVNDGSTDASGQILDECAARDARLRVIHQSNTGLTRALIRGCAEARGEFIARQDSGDNSLPRRLELQMKYLRRSQDSVAISCFTQFVGPKGEVLYTSKVDEDTLSRYLRTGIDGQFRGPSSHPSVMMRRSAYMQAGGYRPCFYFAQDLDLWTRLAEQGHFMVIPEVLIQASLDPKAISGTQTREQQKMAALITRATLARRSGLSESEFLVQASLIRPTRAPARRQREAQGNYFIGSCLLHRDPRAAKRYFAKSIAQHPFLVKAWLRLIQCNLKPY